MYRAYCYRDLYSIYRPLRNYDVSFNRVGEWDPLAALAPDGVVMSPDTAPEDSDPRPIIVESNFDKESMELEPEEEPEEVIPKLMESDPEEEPMEEEPKEEPMESEPESASSDLD